MSKSGTYHKHDFISTVNGKVVSEEHTEHFTPIPDHSITDKNNNNFTITFNGQDITSQVTDLVGVTPPDTAETH